MDTVGAFLLETESVTLGFVMDGEKTVHIITNGMGFVGQN